MLKSLTSFEMILGGALWSSECSTTRTIACSLRLIIASLASPLQQELIRPTPCMSYSDMAAIHLHHICHNHHVWSCNMDWKWYKSLHPSKVLQKVLKVMYARNAMLVCDSRYILTCTMNMNYERHGVHVNLQVLYLSDTFKSYTCQMKYDWNFQSLYLSDVESYLSVLVWSLRLGLGGGVGFFCYIFRDTFLKISFILTYPQITGAIVCFKYMSLKIIKREHLASFFNQLRWQY